MSGDRDSRGRESKEGWMLTREQARQWLSTDRYYSGGGCDYALTEKILETLYDQGMSIVEVMSSRTWHEAHMGIGKPLAADYFDKRCPKCFMELPSHSDLPQYSLCRNGDNIYLFDLTRGQMDSLHEISSGGFRWGGLFVRLTTDEVSAVGNVVINALRRQQAADLAFINRKPHPSTGQAGAT